MHPFECNLRWKISFNLWSKFWSKLQHFSIHFWIKCWNWTHSLSFSATHLLKWCYQLPEQFPMKSRIARHSLSFTPPSKFLWIEMIFQKWFSHGFKLDSVTLIRFQIGYKIASLYWKWFPFSGETIVFGSFFSAITNDVFAMNAGNDDYKFTHVMWWIKIIRITTVLNWKVCWKKTTTEERECEAGKKLHTIQTRIAIEISRAHTECIIRRNWLSY